MFIQFPEVTDVIVKGMDEIAIPRMVTVRQKYDPSKIDDLETHIISKMSQEITDYSQFHGKRICITGGSRGIPHYPLILKTICDQLKEWGAEPFVVPAMGSHGGGTAEGQRKVLEEYGVTETSIGAPILSSMDVVQYGTLSNGTHLYCDKNAYESDGIVLLNKVKAHTDYHGPHESGLAKMIAIGLGKHVGASEFHMQGFPEFARRIPEAAEMFLEKAPVAFGVGIVQNAYDEICELEVARPEKIMDMDEKLLKVAKKRMAVFKFDDLDVLLIDEIGKNISGYGHDPNVTGRANGFDESFRHILRLKKMVIFGVTPESHHNGTGIAEADVTTRRCMNDIDWGLLWTNLITSTEIQGCKMPMYTNSEREAILVAIRTCNGIDFSKVKMARIKNTAEIFEIEVSEALYEIIRDLPDIEMVCGPHDMQFDAKGNLLRQS